jgi:hypothetical protein
MSDNSDNIATALVVGVLYTVFWLYLCCCINGYTKTIAVLISQTGDRRIEAEKLRILVNSFRREWMTMVETRIQAYLDAGVSSDHILLILKLEGVNEDTVARGLVSREFFAKVKELTGGRTQ